jgi:hypothetical protein
MASTALNKLELLGRLDPIGPEKSESLDNELLQSMSLARALRTVAELQSEHAYKLCRDVVEQALGRVPEPAPPIKD